MDNQELEKFCADHHETDDCIVHIEMIQGKASVATAGGEAALLYAAVLLVESLEKEGRSFRKIQRSMNRLHKAHKEYLMAQEYVNDMEDKEDDTQMS